VKELVEYIALSLVDDPSQVVVTQNREGGRENLELHVAKEDMGGLSARAAESPMRCAFYFGWLLPVKANRPPWMWLNHDERSPFSRG